MPTTSLERMPGGRAVIYGSPMPAEAEPTPTTPPDAPTAPPASGAASGRVPDASSEDRSAAKGTDAVGAGRPGHDGTAADTGRAAAPCRTRRDGSPRRADREDGGPNGGRPRRHPRRRGPGHSTPRRWIAWHWFETSKVGLPMVLLVVDVLGTSGAQNGGWQSSGVQAGDIRPLDWIAWLLVVAGPIALYHRRRWPRIALIISLSTTLAYLLAGYVYGPIFLNALVAVIAAIGAGYRREAYAGALAFAVGMLFVPSHQRGHSRQSLVDVLSTVGWLLATLLIAELFRVLRERAREVGRVKEEEARRQASDERLAIARELHDVLAHSISLIAVQANVALEVMDRRPEQARIALTAIKEAARTSLTEVRSVLDVLRGGEQAPRQPAPDLGRLAQLVDQAEAAGLTVRIEGPGDTSRLPLAVSQAAFRIIQESLTNVVRHAGARHADVRVAVGAAELSLSVADDGRGVPLGFTDGTGNGIGGMRERAAAFGGHLTAGPGPGGGFRVSALIPLPGADEPAA